MLARPARVPYLDWGAYEIAKRVTLDHLDALPILLQEATRETIGEEKMV